MVLGTQVQGHVARSWTAPVATVCACSTTSADLTYYSRSVWPYACQYHLHLRARLGHRRFLRDQLRILVARRRASGRALGRARLQIRPTKWMFEFLNFEFSFVRQVHCPTLFLVVPRCLGSFSEGINFYTLFHFHSGSSLSIVLT